jgi:hypothetical protein
VQDDVKCKWKNYLPTFLFLFHPIEFLFLTRFSAKAILNISRCEFFRSPCDRPNLFYEVRNKPAGAEKVIEEIASFIQENCENESGIVYCFSRKDAEQVADGLKVPFHPPSLLLNLANFSSTLTLPSPAEKGNQSSFLPRGSGQSPAGNSSPKLGTQRSSSYGCNLCFWDGNRQT